MSDTQFIGLDIGGTKCALGVETAPGTFAEVARFPTAGPAETLARFATEIEKLPAAQRRAFGISCGGPLDARTGTVLSPPNLPGWDEIRVCAWVNEKFGGPSRLMNDANACALAEWQAGAGRGVQSMMFLTMGTGMGGGLVLDGRLYEGISGSAGEVGHLRLADDGPVGFGKAGSFEGFCSGGGIAQIARCRVAEFSGPSALKQIPREQLSARDVGVAAAAGDALALAIWREVGERLGQAIALFIDLLNPERIVIGGIFPRCHVFITPAMNAVIAREALGPSARDCAIVPAQLGEQIGSRAAVAIARYYFSAP
ncbi:MAG: ROK family protein [Verrucomicrobia bacterium]|nr:ROK family protein [Verrucomicrobiota bacterium]